MITRPALLFIGVASGLVFLIISIHNSRSLNNDLMAKLVETEVNIVCEAVLQGDPEKRVQCLVG